MFIPLALTVVMVLLSSLVLSMTIVPVLAVMLMRPRTELRGPAGIDAGAQALSTALGRGDL